MSSGKKSLDDSDIETAGRRIGRRGAPLGVAAAGELDEPVLEEIADPKARAKELTGLAATDPQRAIVLAMPYLSDEALDARRLFVVSRAALDVLVEHATGEEGEEVARRLVEILLGRPQSGYDAWARSGLERLRWPGTAALVASRLTAESFQRFTGAIRLLEILHARRELGDPAKIEALATDPWSHFAGTDLGDLLMIRVTELAGELIELAREAERGR